MGKLDDLREDLLKDLEGFGVEDLTIVTDPYNESVLHCNFKLLTPVTYLDFEFNEVDEDPEIKEQWTAATVNLGTKDWSYLGVAVLETCQNETPIYSTDSTPKPIYLDIVTSGYGEFFSDAYYDARDGEETPLLEQPEVEHHTTESLAPAPYIEPREWPIIQKSEVIQINCYICATPDNYYADTVKEPVICLDCKEKYLKSAE